MAKPLMGRAREVIEKAKIRYQGKVVGTVASMDPQREAENYSECFVRDFVPCALVFLMDGDFEPVKQFLRTVMHIRNQQYVMAGHTRAEGLMPASFKVTEQDGKQQLIADFGERAIGRVAPVDSAMWWMILLHAYVQFSGDRDFADDPQVQQTIRAILSLYLQESFETSPAMLVPDGSFMIDRRMGVYGHPLEIQSLFYGMLFTAEKYLAPGNDQSLLEQVQKRRRALRTYVRLFYWLDKPRLNEIHRYRSEQFGPDAENLLNIYPASIPVWLDGWFPADGGYFVGNLGPGRMDFRYFSLGNMLAVSFGLATDEQADKLMRLHEHRWMDLIGEMPVKICYPAISGTQWQLLTGCDPKNVAWSYHNGGHWPCLLWPFAAAALRTGRRDLAQQAYSQAIHSVDEDRWQEYYDGKTGALIGRRSNAFQVWTAAAIVLTQLMFERENDVVFSGLFTHQ